MDSYFEIIKNSILQNKLSQVYLFSSNPNIDLDKYVIYFINQINKEKFETFNEIKFGELYFLVKGIKTSTIKKEEMLDACKNATESSLSNQNKHKILVIKNIENSSIASLNSILKFLEEPPANLIVLMTTNNRNKVLKTIKSRAFEIHIGIKKNVDILDKYLEFFNQLSNNEEFLKQINNETTIKLLELFRKKIILAYKDFAELALFLYENLTENNYLMLCRFLINSYMQFYLSNVDASFESKFFTTKDLRTYSPSFPFLKIIKTIKEFLANMSSIAPNFKLQKVTFIAKLGEYYE